MSPLSPRQNELLFLARTRPDRVTAVHQVRFARSVLDLPRLQEAVREVAARHSVMRTRVVWSDDGVPELVEGDVDPGAAVRTASARSAAELDRLAWGEAARGLELATPPGLHLLDVPTSEDEGVLLCTFHLALLGRSGATRLWREIVAAYRGEAPPENGAGAESAGGEAGHRAGGDEHWLRRLGPLELPTPLPFPADEDDDPSRSSPLVVHRPLDPGLLADARARAAELDCDPARVVEAAWSVLLRRYTGRREACFGTAAHAAGSPRPAHDQAVLPLAVSRDGDGDSFRALCRALEEQTRDRDALGSVAPTSVHRALGLSPALRLHETSVALEREPWATRGDGAGPVQELLRERSWTDDALRVVVAAGARPALRVEVDPARVEPGAGEAVADHFPRLLRALLDEPEARAVTRPFLGEEERARLRSLGSGGAPVAAGEAHFLARLALQVRTTPDAVAVAAGGTTVTYAELDRASGALAQRLREAGVDRDTRVAVVGERRPEVLVALLAILRAGGAYVPLDPAYPAERRSYMLEDSGAALLLVPPGAPPLPEAARTLPVPGIPELLDGAGEAFPDASPDPASLAYVIYTSGSTGKPKGVAMVHRALSNLVAWQLRASGAGVGDRTLQFASLSFDVSFQEIFATWCSGGTLVLVDEEVRRNPVALLELLERERISRLFLPFVALQQLAQAAAVAGRSPTSLREIAVAGEQLRITEEIRNLVRGAAPCRLENHYGPAETHVVTAHRLGEDPQGWPVLPAIGRPLPGTEIHLLDPWGAPVPVGVVGEMHVGGVALARGYLDRPELTAERFVPHPEAPERRVYRTGDLARRGPDGTLEFVGRVDHQVKIRGFRVEPGEVESVLEAHPAVGAAAVVPGVDTGGSRTLLAFVVPTGAELDPAAVRAHVAERLPGHMVPARVLALDALPLTPSGKVDRRRLSRLEPPATQAPTPPAGSGSLEAVVTRVWARILELDQVPSDRSFFELGGTSVLTLRTAVALSEALGRPVPVTALFEYPTAAKLARHLEAEERGGSGPSTPTVRVGTRSGAVDEAAPVAIVGMDCRLPGSDDVETFWRNLLEGRDGIRHFSREELLEAGVDPALLDDPDYVRARGMIDGAERFDAGFFGYSPREARLMDPQHRLFLESCWKALESAGYPPDRTGTAVGVWGGMSTGMGYTTYLLSNLVAGDGVSEADRLPMMLGNAYDYLTTRVSYKLDLRGPSVNVQTACSTSLVAVCQAVQSLRRHECDLALAGGVSVAFPQRSGYMHQEGGIESSDGRCRPFDAGAEGTVFSDGVATVALRRLEDALRDGDPIHAVIHGIGVNNDGSDKVSFSAPSVLGQASAIRTAQEEAGFAPRSIGYVEAHGTATQLGDPIEVQALRRAFGEADVAEPWCALGSVKSNIGHTVAAAGAAALIKTALGLREGVIPPSLHFERPNEGIDLPGSPFFVASERRPWPGDGGPRRAGVSSFGLGGTNAHVVLEEPPAAAPTRPGRRHDLLVLSARDDEALAASRERFATDLAARAEEGWWDAAHTTRVGRSPLSRRCAVVAGGTREAAGILRGDGSPDLLCGSAPPDPPEVAFLFPGGGAQYPGMGRDLLEREPVFRSAVAECAALLPPRLDLRAFLRGGTEAGADAADLERPAAALPFLFAVEYALARLWMSWGVRPSALLGHSMGEYTAACLAGVLSLEDAAALVVARGRLFETLPPGAMTAVPLSEEALRSRLPAELAVAVVNGPESCVASGPSEAVAALEARLETEGIEARRVHIAVAAHSPMVEAILDDFRAVFDGIRLQPPAIPCLSNVTGTWLTPEEATSPDYWVRQLRGTVRFSDDVATLAERGRLALVEVGPGRTLASLARMHPATDPGTPVVASLRHPREEVDDERFLLRSLGRLWTGGVEVDWPEFVQGQERRRVTLPTYPFRGPPYLVAPARIREGADAQDGAPTQVPAGSGAAAGGEASDAIAALQQQLETLAARTPTAMAASPPQPPPESTPPPRSSAVSRRDRILAKLKEVVRELSGIAPEELPSDVSFLDMGFDSLFLTQASLGFKKALGVRVTFRQLFEEAPNLGALADFIDGELDEGVEVEDPGGAGRPAPVENARAAAAPSGAAAPAGPAPATGLSLPDPSAGGLDIHRILAFQLQSTAALLTALAGGGATATATPREEGATAPEPTREGEVSPPSAAGSPGPPPGTSDGAADAPEGAGPAPRPARASGPYRELNRERVGGLTERQSAFLAEFTERYVARTRRSKELTQAHRDVFADPRAVAGFRKDWKEIVYPLAVDRSQGSRMWDIDGNEYVDAVSGFGAIFFGHAPDFVVEAVDRQLHHSLDYGPQSTIAGEVARMVCEFTGMDRVSFCNTGSEAVLAAMRSARTATGHDTIVTFNGDYHGIFDEVLVRRQVIGNQTRNVPVAPGIPRSASQNMVVLDYGDPASLDRIRELGDELAGVLVEPVQSRTPELQPREFLHGLRKLCTEIEVPLIFDEIITGFRSHPRGAQGWFGVQADIAAYGKVVGGGMPIGIVAGTSLYLDSLDGGTWRFGDDSFPEAGVTYFAGTFIRHPLSLSAVHAVLRHLKEHDGELQRTVNDRTARLAVEVNDYFERRGLPIHIVHFSSVFLPRFGGPPEFDPIFHRLLHHHGLHLWEGRPGFLTTAHTEADVDRMIEAFMRAAEEMVEGGLLHPSNGGASDAPQLREVALTDPQTEIWLATQMGEEGARAFNEPVRLDLEGPLHVPALERAVRKVVERHEGLRATVRSDEPALRIHRSMEVPLRRVDLAEFPEEERERALAEHLMEESSSSFDLEHGPLIRFKLIRLAEERHALVVTVHHIVCDGWSIEITLRDLAAFYNHAYTGRELELDPPMQLSEYNEHHRARQRDPEVSEMRRYWMERFDPVPPVLDLPTDRPRPPQKSYAGARLAVQVERSVGVALKELSAARGCTLFTTLLAAFGVLLQKLSGQSDVVVGVPAAGQALLGENALVAHCVSFLPIRSTVAPERPFAAYLHELRGIVMDANDNQEYTYGALVEELSLPRDPSRVPLLSASFNLDPEISGLEFHGLAWRYVPVPRSFSKLDIDLNVIETDGELLLEIDHNADLLDGATALRWMEHYERLLRAIVADPERPIGELEVVEVSEQARLIAGDDPVSVEAAPARIEELVDARVARSPDAPALLHEGRTLSYAELDARARRVAAGLRNALDRGREGPVGILLDRSPEMVATLLGILKAGRAWVPLDPDFPSSRLDLVVQDAGLAALVTDGVPDLHLPDGTPVLQVDDLLREEPQEAAEGRGDPEELAYIIYTSGSTGRPKGVEVPHRAVVNFLRSMAERPGMGPSDRLLAVTTISFDISVLELFLPLTVGGTVILASREVARDGVALARLMEESVPTVMQATPTHWQLLVESGWSGHPELKVLAGGEPLPAALAETLASSCGELWNMYGPTETTIWSTCARIRPGDGTVPIGRPIAATRAYVLDAELRPVPPGVAGELWLGGAGLARGYRNRPEQSAERFVTYPHDPAPGRLYGTGDVVRYRADGVLEFVGRADRQVKVRGFRVELGDVESALATHPGVDRAVASVRDLGSGDVRLVAHFTGEEGLDEGALRSHLRATLPEYMVPQALVWMEAFPRTANGKLDVRALPVPFAADEPGPAAPDAWEDEVEASIAAVWREVLGVATVGRLQDFFDLGGHSVLATRVVSRLRTGLAPGLALRDLFRHSTVAGLAERVRGLRSNGHGESMAQPETEEFVL